VEHTHPQSGIDHKLKIAILVTALVLAVELIGGYLANSLALLSDAGHVFTDVLALLLSWFGVRQAQRPASHRMTYGYHRIGILVALINAISLVAIAGIIFYEAYQRFLAPEQVTGSLMLGVAMGGLIANLAIIFVLHSEEHRNLNVRSAFLHVAGDALASVGVIIGGLVILFTGVFWIDPLLSVLIGLIIGYGSWGVIREGVSIFLEASPEHVDVEEMVSVMRDVPGVEDIHDLHVWTIAPGIHSLSAHVTIDDVRLSESTAILNQLNNILCARFDIGHTAIQFECAGCTPHGLYCRLAPNGAGPNHDDREQ
jgi:cobalt-zinc-cadmium efflux system protein